MIRKSFFILITLVFMLSLTIGSFAGEAAREEKPAAPEKPAKEKKPAAEPAETEETTPSYDKVILKNGEVVEGYVLDAGGPKIRVQRALGARVILKSDIKDIEVGKGRTIESGDEDLVFTASGEILPGRVRVDPNTGKIHLTRKTAAGKGEIVLSPKEVLRIRYSDPAKNKALSEKTAKADTESNPKVALVVDALLKDLASDNADSVAQAEKALIKLGIFAEAEIASALENATDAYRIRLHKLDKLAKLKRAVAPAIVTEFPDIYDCMMNTKYEPKLEILQLVLMLYPEDAPPILVHTALDSISENELIRRYCVKQLNDLGRPQELVTILEQAEPRLAMVAAIYLGERGILIGLPLLIEALNSKREKIRLLALNKLRDFTRQDFGGTPYDPPEVRVGWIAKWKKWLKENEKRISRQAAIVRNEDVPEEDRRQSDFLYRKAQIAYEADNVSEALFLFEEALRHNPANVAAHMNIAVLMYQETKDFVGARERLLKLLKFYEDRVSSANLRDIFFHLGMIALAEKDWPETQKRFFQSTMQDGKFVKGYLALAKSYQAQLDMDNDLRPGPNANEESIRAVQVKREQILKSVLGAYQEAEALISGTRNAMNDEDFVADWREAVADLESEKRSGPPRPRMQTPVPSDLIREQRRMLKRRHAVVLYETARVYHALDNIRDAILTIEEACKLLPGDTDLLFHAAILYEIAGNPEDAAGTYGKILKIDPDHEMAQQNLDLLKKQHPDIEENK